MILEYLRDPGLIDTAEMKRIETLPIAASQE